MPRGLELRLASVDRQILLAQGDQPRAHRVTVVNVNYFFRRRQLNFSGQILGCGCCSLLLPKLKVEPVLALSSR
jgi:hypothetical protein